MSQKVSRPENWITSVVREALLSGSSSELLKALVEAFPGSWFFTRIDATFAHVNQNACDSLGYTREELMSLTLYDVDPNLTQELWDSLLELGPYVPASVRTLHKRKDGSTFPVEAFGSRIILSDENVSVSYVVDLSEETEAREALAQKEHLLQSVLNQAPVIILLLDASGRVQLAEGSGLAVIGLDPSSAVTKNISELSLSAPELVQAMRGALEGRSFDGTLTVGSVHLAYRFAPRFSDQGEVAGATVVALDVTDRYNAERANQRLLAAIEQSAECVVLMDAEGRMEYVNPAFESTTGYQQEEVIGGTWSSSYGDDGLRSVGDGSPADRADLQLTDTVSGKSLLEALASGNGWSGAVQRRKKEGATYVEQVTLSPLRDAQGRVTGFVAVSRDTTEELRTQERLRHAQKMDAVGGLAGGIAHDFNNLLQVILGNIQLCYMRTPPAQIRTLLKEMEQASERAANLVSQLLTFARSNAVERKTLDLVMLVERLMPIMQRLLGEHVAITLHGAADPLPVWGDGTQLEQIIMNLCVNARDAMPGGGRVDIGLGWQEFDAASAKALGLKEPGSYVILQVADTGYGMTEAVRSRIFEPFFTTKGATSGTGLGLSTVYAIARDHNGAVEVDSKPGEGSRFRVILPRSQSPVERSDLRERRRGFRDRRSLVLLAEDDPSVHRVSRAFLEDAGHEVLSARDGREALFIIDERGTELDLAVIDAIMPGANGPEVYRQLRLVSSIPVLFVTGFEFNALETLPEDPARALLRKPFDPLALQREVSRLLLAVRPDPS